MSQRLFEFLQILDQEHPAWLGGVVFGPQVCISLRRLRQLEEENRRLKSIVADQALDIRALKDVLAKNGSGPR